MGRMFLNGIELRERENGGGDEGRKERAFKYMWKGIEEKRDRMRGETRDVSKEKEKT